MSLLPAVRTALPSHSLARRRLMTAVIVLTVCVLAGVMYCFPPTEYTFYPRCLFHDTTGLHCAGCGGTRCVYALLHGDLAQAAAYNILVLVYLPYLTVTAFNACWHAVVGQPLFRRSMPGWVGKATVIAFLLFWILRNLPIAPFSLLAPHKL